MINSIAVQDHCGNRVILCAKRQGIKSRCPVSYDIGEDDKTDIVQIGSERQEIPTARIFPFSFSVDGTLFCDII